MVLSLILACVPYNPATPAVEPPANQVDSEGGMVSEGGVVLDIPAGALPEPVVIRIVDTEEAPPEAYEGLSTVWTFEPDGLVFAEPITVSIPYDDSTPLTRMFWSTEDGTGFEVIDATFSDGVATAQIEHFSSGFVAITPTEEFSWDDYYPPADVLVVVDNSCSMFDRQQQLGANATVFFDTFEASGLDFHLGAVSTDMQATSNAGKLRNVAGNKFVEPSTPQGRMVFDLMVNMGTSGWYEEKGRAAAWSLLEPNRDIPRNHGFYRDHATLDIIMLSDEDDQSGANPITLQNFQTWVHELKPDPADATVHGIVGLPGPSCLTDSIGAQYIAAVDDSGGELIDICDPDWTAGLQAIVERRLAGAFVELDQEPGEIVEVAFDAAGAVRLVLEHSEYSVDGTVVRFDQGIAPEMGDTVRVRYRPL